MARVSGGSVLVGSLLAQGAECVFTLCGNHLLSVYDAAIGTRLRLVDVRQESAAAHMADAWTRVTGRPGVCLVTGGPGHTNALTGVATAWAADSPIIFLSGSSERALRGKGAMQELDQVGLARPIVKWAAEVEDARQIPGMLARAYRVAQTAARPRSPDPSGRRPRRDRRRARRRSGAPAQLEARRAGPPPNPAAMERALSALAQSERPIAIAGAGAWWSDAGEQLREFVEAAGVPLFTIDTARGLVSDDHPLCFGYADPLLNPAANLFGEADLVLLLGKRLDFRLRFGDVFAPEAAIVQIDAEALDLGQNRTVEVPVVGDVALALEQLLQSVRSKGLSFEPWVRRLGRAAAEGVLARAGSRAPTRRRSTRSGSSARYATCSATTTASRSTPGTSSSGPARRCQPGYPAAGSASGRWRRSARRSRSPSPPSSPGPTPGSSPLPATGVSASTATSSTPRSDTPSRSSRSSPTTPPGGWRRTCSSGSTGRGGRLPRSCGPRATTR